MIRVLQYNTHLFIDMVVSLVSSQVYEDADRRAAIANTIQLGDFDIVGLSEVWSNKSKKYLIQKTLDIFPYSHWDCNDNPFQAGSGLVLLSKYPISQANFFKFKSLTGTDALSQKGFLVATVQHPTGDFVIVHTHTQAGISDEEGKVRKSNLEQLINVLHDAAKSSEDRGVLLGDLNVIAEREDASRTVEYMTWRDAFATLGFSDAFRAVNPKADAAPGYTYDAVNNSLISRFAPSDASSKQRQRIDYVFAKGFETKTAVVLNTQFRVQTDSGELDLSDHYALQVELV